MSRLITILVVVLFELVCLTFSQIDNTTMTTITTNSINTTNQTNTHHKPFEHHHHQNENKSSFRLVLLFFLITTFCLFLIIFVLVIAFLCDVFKSAPCYKNDSLCLYVNGELNIDQDDADEIVVTKTKIAKRDLLHKSGILGVIS